MTKLTSDGRVTDEAPVGVSVDPDELRKPGRWWAPIVMAVVLAASIIVALAIGPSWLPVSQVWDVLAHHLGENNHPTPTANAIVWDLRLPRTVLAALCGAGLAVTGAVMQAVLAIPIADPYILGTSSGASLGAVIVLVVLKNSGAGALSIGAFAGALGAFLIVMIIGWGSRSSPSRVLLAGVAVGYMADAVFSLILTKNANAQQTQDLTFWTLGSFGGATWNQIILVLMVVILVSCFCMARARGMDALVFGDELATAVGVDANRLRRQLSVVVALLTAVMVAVCGEIGFIGLVIPNVGRWMVGIGHRWLLPVVAVGGAVFAVWADTIARTVFAPTEVPVGVISALVGAPFFIVLLVSRKEQI